MDPSRVSSPKARRLGLWKTFLTSGYLGRHLHGWKIWKQKHNISESYKTKCSIMAIFDGPSLPAFSQLVIILSFYVTNFLNWQNEGGSG